jgi:hypothetical protein
VWSMVRVQIEVVIGRACVTVMVRAESIQRALSMVESRFLSCDDIRVVHPIDPETFFVKDPAASEELAEADTLEGFAGALEATG